MSQIEVTHDGESDHLWDWPLQHHDDLVHVHNDQDKWEVGLDAGFYRPDEIEVNRLGQKLFIVCKHGERASEWGNFNTSRELKRNYTLPDDVNLATLSINLTRTGILHISAKKNHIE